MITLGGIKLHGTDVHHLQEHIAVSANRQICSMEASRRTLCTEWYQYQTWMLSVQHMQPTELYTVKICHSEVSTTLVMAEKYRPETEMETEFVMADICECETQFETMLVCKFHPKQVCYDQSLSIFPLRPALVSRWRHRL